MPVARDAYSATPPTTAPTRLLASAHGADAPGHRSERGEDHRRGDVQAFGRDAAVAEIEVRRGVRGGDARVGVRRELRGDLGRRYLPPVGAIGGRVYARKVAGD